MDEAGLNETRRASLAEQARCCVDLHSSTGGGRRSGTLPARALSHRRQLERKDAMSSETLERRFGTVGARLKVAEKPWRGEPRIDIRRGRSW